MSIFRLFTLTHKHTPSRAHHTHCPLPQECVCANVIADGLINGYVAHEHKKVVLSQTDPFPLRR